MAQYSVFTGPLFDAGDSFSIVADELASTHERLAAVLAGWQESAPDEARRLLAASGESVCVASKSARDFARTLFDVSEIYAHADRSAFSQQELEASAGAALLQPVAALAAGGGASGVLFTDSLVLPLWLKDATLRYLQGSS